MLTTLMVALLFFAAGTVVLASGIFTWQADYKALTNRVFLLITIALAIWSFAMGSSTVVPDAATCETLRRISALGWGTVYALTLHFILIITGKAPTRKWWLYFCLYLPAFLTVFMFAIPNKINPYPYHLQQSAYGWINVSRNNLWDWIFYAYYIGYIILGLWLLYRWGKETADVKTKKKARVMTRALLLALVLGTLTDVVLNSLIALPQMAPVVMLIPSFTIFHLLQKDSFNITEGLDRNTSYLVLYISVLIYIILAATPRLLVIERLTDSPLLLEETVLRGIIVQIQMFISLYLVLKENRPGYISAVIMNLISLTGAFAVFLRDGLLPSLVEIIAYTGVLVIITLIKSYKEKNTAYIKKINTQAVREKFYSNVFKQAPVGIAILSDTKYAQNEKYGDVSINPAYEQIVGRTKEELKKINWTEITHPDDLPTDLEYFEQFKQGKIDAYSREKRYIKPDGSVVWVDMLVSRFASANENPGDHVCIITDITERKQIENILKYTSEHEPLTGLYNRSVLEKILARDATLPASVKRALVCVNLFAMHALSVRYGYYYNQTMLKKIAYALQTFCSDQSLLFDINEYRFVYYLKNYEDEKELTALCEKVANTVYSYLYVHGIEFGIGVLPVDQLTVQNPDEILKKLMNTSELAVRKERKSSNLLFYSPEIDRQITRENEISREIQEIAEGVKTDRLNLQYQPILDLAAKKICGFEALARLHSEKHGLISPLEFIPIAEKTNMIAPLGEKIIRKALRFLNKLETNGHDRIGVSINVSVLQILEEGFLDKLLAMINDLQVNPRNVGIELTESVFATEWSELNKVIGRLKAAGIKVMIDDFGTGYSSFARQQDLNIDCLKIDKSFIDKLLVKPEEAITGDIISMAHKMGKCVVAEGVEHTRQLRYLQEHSCDRIQGFLIAEPLEEEAALDVLFRSIPTQL